MSSRSTPVQLLPLGQCLLLWHRRVDALWHQTPKTLVTRTITRGPRAGVQETIARRGQRQVCDGAKATGEALLKRYRKQVERLLQVPLLFGQLVTDTGEWQLPSILVDARQLMLQRSLTERTMRNHLAQLLAVGFITRKKWHGRRRSFELWIAPELVCKAAEKAVESPLEAASSIPTTGSDLSTNGTKFPVIELPDLPKELKVEIGQWGKNASDEGAEKPSPEAEGCTQADGAGGASKTGQGGRAAAETALVPPPAPVPTLADLAPRYQAYVIEAWLYAKALLYPEHRFSAHQELLAQQAILRGVYRGFTDPCFDFARYHQGVLRRLELVEKHFSRHAGRSYAPMPWAEMIEGRGYFDWANERGFRGTMAWLLKDQRAEHLARINRAVAKAVGELKLRRKLELGEKTPLRVPRRLVEVENRRTLFQQHLSALEQLGGRLATDKYLQLAERLLR